MSPAVAPALAPSLRRPAQASPGRPAITPPSAPQPDERFRFHPRATNPELWRTTLPLVVYERCGGHKGLVATWLAIHWLIVLHAASGRRDFGVREIAARACVGRNELTGPRGYIQRLVDLGLLQIVGYDNHHGQFRAPRPVYHLDLWELERLSLELIPDVLRAQGVAPPPRPAPDPRQTSFLDALDEPPANGTGPEHAGAPVHATPALEGAEPRALHGTGIGGRGHPALLPGISHETRTGPQPAPPQLQETLPETGPAPYRTRTGSCTDTPNQHESVPVMHGTRTAHPGRVPALAQNWDVEGGNERANEGVSEFARSHAMLEDVAAQAAQVVLQTLQQQGLLTMAPSSQPTPTPDGHPALPDTLIALWQGDRGAVSARDRHQLQMLAGEYDRPTEGYGAYWVGRAILITDRCLAERGQSLSVNYLRGMLRRWQREGSWGSDLDGEAGDAPTPLNTGDARGAAAPAAGQRREASPQQPRSATPDTPPPPAVAAYVAAFGRTPNAVQAEQIVATVTKLATWRQVLTDWQAHGWKESAVANMLDRYRKEAGAPADQGPPLSVAVIHRYPGLTDAQRDRWITRFHAAATPAEKRAVISRLEQEHPR